ncbi:hypothetical protein BGZ49_004373, partial [Haplosporangium sp. Z 27]
NHCTSDTTSSTDLILTAETSSPRQKRKQSATPPSRRKKQAFVIYVKDSCTVDMSNQDSSDLSESSSGLRLAFMKFQTTSAKFVLPGRDISTLLPEALSLNGIWWANEVPLGMPSKEHILFLT